MKVHSDITKIVGNTPLVKLNRITDGATAEVYAKLASCYSSVGDIEKSLENYEKSFELSPNYKILSSLIFCSNFKNDY